jgi:hypothetical protein
MLLPRSKNESLNSEIVTLVRVIMSLEYIRKTYQVPAKRGVHVIANGQPGVITGARGAHLRVRVEGTKKIRFYHPAWEMQYLPETRN